MQGDTSQALVPVREEMVTFYDDTIMAALLDDGKILVPLRPICENLGLAWSSQLQRTRRDPALAAALSSVFITNTGSVTGASSMIALPLDMLPGWLFGVSPTRVKAELQEKVNRYRAECFRVLWEHFKGQVMPSPPMMVTATGAEQALAIAEAVVEIARQQVELERRHNTMADYMRGHVRNVNAKISEYGERLTALELQVGGAGLISDGQALEIAGAVKAVAHALNEKGEKSAYQRVYGELYRRFNVSGYKNLPTARYEETIAWLKGWHEEIVGEGEQP